MAHACGCRSDSPGVLDVRGTVPEAQDSKIVAAVDALASSEAFVLVTDGDPTLLFRTLDLERPGTLRRRYLEDGPDVWRVEIGTARVAVSAEEIVGDVARRHPGTLDVMKKLGINHCCGAQLTLAEAAAAAGVPLDALLGALDESPSAFV